MGFHWISLVKRMICFIAISQQSPPRSHLGSLQPERRHSGLAAGCQVGTCCQVGTPSRFRNQKKMSVLICLHLEMCHVGFSALLVIAPSFLWVNSPQQPRRQSLSDSSGRNKWPGTSRQDMKAVSCLGENKVSCASPVMCTWWILLGFWQDVVFALSRSML